MRRDFETFQRNTVGRRLVSKGMRPMDDICINQKYTVMALGTNSLLYFLP